METLLNDSDVCLRLVASPIDLVLNTFLLIVLIAIQYPQCAYIIKSESTIGISAYHFFLEIFYQTMFMSSVLYISSFPEGPIECCRPHGDYGPDPNGNNDWHLDGIQAYGVLLGILQVGVVFLGSGTRLALFFIYTPLFPPLTGDAISRVAAIYARIITAILSFLTFCIFVDALATTLAPNDQDEFLTNSGEHKLMMTACLFFIYFFSGWLQHLPQLARFWKNSETENSAFSVKALMLQPVPMILLGVSLGMRDVKWAQKHTDELHNNREWFVFLFFVVGACEAWIIAVGQAVTLLIIWRSRRTLNVEAQDEADLGDEANERTRLLTPTSSIDAT